MNLLAGTHYLSQLTESVAASAHRESPEALESSWPSGDAWSFLLLQPAGLPRRYAVFALLQQNQRDV